MTKGLRKPAQEDLIEDDNSDSESICGATNEEMKGKGIICWLHCSSIFLCWQLIVNISGTGANTGMRVMTLMTLGQSDKEEEPSVMTIPEEH